MNKDNEKFEYIDSIIRDSLQDYKVDTNIQWQDIDKHLGSLKNSRLNTGKFTLFKILGLSITIAAGIFIYFSYKDRGNYTISAAYVQPIKVDRIRVYQPIDTISSSVDNRKEHFLSIHKRRNVKDKDTVIEIVYTQDTTISEVKQ